jgi:hypothetical protein
MAIEIVDLPSYKMVIFHSYVSLVMGVPLEIASDGFWMGKSQTNSWMMKWGHNKHYYPILSI